MVSVGRVSADLEPRLVGARVVLALAVVAVVLAACPGMARAEITTKAATIDGVTSTSAPPGSVMNATVAAAVSLGTTWSATEVQFGAQAHSCVNHENEGFGPDRHASFKVTAPGAPGSYDVGFQPNESGDCTGSSGSTFTLNAGLRVTQPGPNPDLPPRCGINVMLVLDESGSIASSGQTETVKGATTAFLNALSGTGAKVSIIDFSTTAAQQVKYTTVTPDSITNVFNPYLRDGYRPSGWTNWEAAFQKVHQANKEGGTLADLVVFMTDGDPTAHNNAGGSPTTGLTEGDVTAMRPAAEEADLVKADGSHVLALGVGAAVTKPASASRLTAVSGFDETPPAPFPEGDFTLVKDFDKLAAALRKIAVELCQASVTVTKLVDKGDGVFREDQGWDFTATVSTSPGGFTWVLPTTGIGTSRTATTDDAGVATFQWKPANPGTATSTVTLQEAVKPNFDFVDAGCKVTAVTAGGSSRRVVRRTRSTTPTTTVTVGPGQYATCTVRNKIRQGTIEIEKQGSPQGSQAFAFTGSLGSFTLVDDVNGHSSSKVFGPLPPGTSTVSELVPDNWELTGITCTPAAAAAITGPQVVITLVPEGAVACTYSDSRIDPPPPEPQPTPPPAPPEPGQPTPPAVTPAPATGAGSPVPAAQIRVAKTSPRVARVGDRIPFTLTVTNTGSVAATNVQVADVPPAALTLTGLSATAGMRLVRGNAVWRLGTLSPGATRTVRGSVLIKSGTPGLKRNLVLATAVNAHLVTGRADTRVLAQRISPNFTG